MSDSVCDLVSPLKQELSIRDATLAERLAVLINSAVLRSEIAKRLLEISHIAL